MADNADYTDNKVMSPIVSKISKGENVRTQNHRGSVMVSCCKTEKVESGNKKLDTATLVICPIELGAMPLAITIYGAGTNKHYDRYYLFDKNMDVVDSNGFLIKDCNTVWDNISDNNTLLEKYSKESIFYIGILEKSEGSVVTIPAGTVLVQYVESSSSSGKYDKFK